MLPTIINITKAAMHDSRGFTQRIYEAGSIIVEDKEYNDFELFKARTEAAQIGVEQYAFIRTAAKKHLQNQPRLLQLHRKSQHLPAALSLFGLCVQPNL